MSRRFSPRLIPTLAALAAASATFSLGNWQSGRAAEKQLIQDRLNERRVLPALVPDLNKTADDLMYRQFMLRGVFMPERMIFLDNKSHESRVGLHVVVPLRVVDANKTVMVNLGWVSRPRDYPKTPDIRLPAGELDIKGEAVPPVKRFLELTKETAQGSLWQNYTVDRAEAHVGTTVYPLLVNANPTFAGLLPTSDAPDAGIDKHRGYAFQWYALSALVILLWLGLNFRSSERT